MVSNGYQSPWMNDELRIYRNMVRRFVREEFAPQQADWRQQHQPEADAWKKAGETGLLLSAVPEEYGGGGGTFAHEAIATEELAQAGVHFACLNHNIAARYILAYGNEEQKQTWLPRMACGELVGAIAMTEASAGSDLQSIKTIARRNGEGYVINGSKTFISNAIHAGILCLAVKTDARAAGPKAISLLLVETNNLSGYKVGRPIEKIGMNAIDTCELFFENVQVPIENLLGSNEGNGFSQMMEQLRYERLIISISAVATAEEAIAITAKYVKERTAFGKPLIEFQNARFKLAECKTEVHIGRVFLDQCIQSFIAGQLDTVTAAMAKYWLTECQCRVVDECVQLHGGYGYMMEYPISRMWADSRVQRIYAGANEIMKELIGWSI
jgi:acyl-CoA dehydrogenase